jgi:hypothetical protein
MVRQLEFLYSGSKPATERVCRALGSIGQTRVHIGRLLADYAEHYHTERNHQGKGNVILFPKVPTPETSDRILVWTTPRNAWPGVLRICRAHRERFVPLGQVSIHGRPH